MCRNSPLKSSCEGRLAGLRSRAEHPLPQNSGTKSKSIDIILQNTAAGSTELSHLFDFFFPPSSVNTIEKSRLLIVFNWQTPRTLELRHLDVTLSATGGRQPGSLGSGLPFGRAACIHPASLVLDEAHSPLCSSSHH